jgi:hypothetical protein
LVSWILPEDLGECNVHLKTNTTTSQANRVQYSDESIFSGSRNSVEVTIGTKHPGKNLRTTITATTSHLRRSRIIRDFQMKETFLRTLKMPRKRKQNELSLC